MAGLMRFAVELDMKFTPIAHSFGLNYANPE
jgi:hypothetical protein